MCYLLVKGTARITIVFGYKIAQSLRGRVMVSVAYISKAIPVEIPTTLISLFMLLLGGINF